MAVKTKNELTIQNNNWITTNGNREITGALVNSHLKDIIDSYANIGAAGGGITYYDATVGNSAVGGLDGDYLTVKSALNAGHYALKVIGDTTETIDWGGHSKDIILDADSLRTINFSVVNTGSIKLYAKNINFSLTGTNVIFDNIYIYLDNCKITGNADYNKFWGEIYATNLDVIPGTGGIDIFYIRGVDVLNITNSGSGNRIVISGGYVNKLNLYGTFSSGGSIVPTNSIIYHLHKDVQDASYILLQRSTILKSTGQPVSIYLRYDDCIVKNAQILTLSYFSGVDVSDCVIENCDITNALSVHNFASFKDNRTNALTVPAGYDNVTISNCKVSTGTITIDALAENTIIENCTTVTPIIYDGVNTRLSNNTSSDNVLQEKTTIIAKTSAGGGDILDLQDVNEASIYTFDDKGGVRTADFLKILTTGPGGSYIALEANGAYRKWVLKSYGADGGSADIAGITIRGKNISSDGNIYGYNLTTQRLWGNYFTQSGGALPGMDIFGAVRQSYPYKGGDTFVNGGFHSFDFGVTESARTDLRGQVHLGNKSNGVIHYGMQMIINDITADYITIKQDYLIEVDASSNAVEIELLEPSTDNQGQTFVIDAYDATNVISIVAYGNTSFDVDTITNPVGTTFRYNLNGTPDLSNVHPLDKIKITNSLNALNDGYFLVTAVDNVNKWIEITNASGITEVTDSPSEIQVEVYREIGMIAGNIWTFTAYENRNTYKITNKN